MATDNLHLAVFPWLALGHTLPFLELSKRLAAEGHRVSFLSTPKNIARLPQIPPHLTHVINFVHLHLPSTPNLPSSAETTIDLPSQHLRPHLRIAFDSLDRQFARFLRTASPDWVLFDYAPYWVPGVAAELGIPCAYVGLYSAAVLAFMGPASVLKGVGEGVRTRPEHLTVKPKWVPFESNIAYRAHEARELFAPSIVPDASGVSEAYRFGAAIDGCDVVAVRSCPEFEDKWLSLLGEIYGKPTVPIGLLPPFSYNSRDSSFDFRWLDGQKQGSVVYAAFGSESKLSAAQLFEIGSGLELSGLPFLWALRKPCDEDGVADLLPNGFAERVGARGLICLDWVPQVDILAHPSVGGFLTHCGWSSIIEGLAAGVGMALLPLMFDQGLNARIVEEKGLGLEVRRSEEDGSFRGEDIAETVRLLMVGEDGESVRERVRGVFGNEELQKGHLRDFVKHLRSTARIDRGGESSAEVIV